IPGEMLRWGVGGRHDPKWGFMPRGHGALSMWGLPFFDRISRARVMSQPIERFGELNSMMSWAEAAAEHEHISREAADRWALRSHQRACAAIDQGKFKDEIVAVTVPQPRGEPLVVDTDEPPRRETSLEKLSRLKPVYPDGVCTAGNASSENDGAAAVVLMAADRAEALGVTPLAVLESFAVAATDPTLTYPAVPAAVNGALDRAGFSIDQIDLIEIQEAFAVQVLADAKLMGVSEEDCDRKINVNGSGISLGHPIAATGTMRLVTLAHEMRRRRVHLGLVAICGGGGQGIAAVIRT
ncbi:MAG: acetyl-CoA C-acyltransferase, partial [Desulfobacterales bacterium]|nr:acetyl-CoA C-acyltransferase [Desulfobacterales bacterium]